MIDLSSAEQRLDPVRQFARFLVVGVGNTAVSYATHRLLLVARTPYSARPDCIRPPER